MRAAVIGVGGVGRVLARELAAEPGVESVLLIDKIKLPSAVVDAFRGPASVETRTFDASSRSAVARAIRGCDVVANTSMPSLNFGLMRAAVDAGVDYVDVASTGPRRPGGLPGILEQLKFHEAFKKAGRTALLSMGLDPGISNVLARDSADCLDTVEEIRIRSGGTVHIRDRRRFPRFVPLYSRDAFFADMRIPPTIWEGGRLIVCDTLSGEEDYAFPSPVGTQRTFLVAHEEVKTLPLYVGKSVRRVDFKYAVNPDLAGALRSLGNLGLFEEDREVGVDHHRIAFREAFESVFPEPAVVAQRLDGVKCLVVEVEGTRGGVRKIVHSDILLAHREAARRRQTTAVYYLTGVAAAIGVLLLYRDGLPPEGGVYPAESLDPAQVFAEWAARDLPRRRIERSAST